MLCGGVKSTGTLSGGCQIGALPGQASHDTPITTLSGMHTVRALPNWHRISPPLSSPQEGNAWAMFAYAGLYTRTLSEHFRYSVV